MRLHAKLCLSVGLLALGCGKADRPVQESPESAAARVFQVAQNLEKEHKNKQAFAAYRQIVRLYPETPDAKNAAERIAQMQKGAMVRNKR